MKVRTSFLTRCVAMVLALLMTISGVNLGAVLQVHAADDNIISYGALMANHYGLTGAEKDLLYSGYLAGSEKIVEWNNLPEGLVKVDKESTTITAESKDGWVPTNGVITYGDRMKVIDLSSGSYNYGADSLGNAFTVKVDYVYETTEVSVDAQSAILEIIPALKQGVANTDAVAAQGGNLLILEEAMPELVNFANNGVETSMGSVGFADDVKAAIYALNNQMSANSGKLNLSVMVAEYEDGSKTAYLRDKGAAMQAELKDSYNNIVAIEEAMNTMYDNLALFIQNNWVSETQANQIKLLAGVCKNLKDGLTAVAEDPWTVANNPALVNKSSVGYASLDGYVAGLGELKTIDPVASLRVADASQSFNMSMFNVTVEVILKTTQNNVVEEKDKQSTVITMTEGTEKADILAAANAYAGTVIDTWGEDYKAEKFDCVADTLPETLIADITYTITYSPKNYTVTIADEEPAEYPYGYVLTLPVHEDPTKSYDYKADGKYYAQGTEVTIEDNMTFTREEGKSYTGGNLYQIISDNYGTAKITAILTSGAVIGNEVVSYREPSKAELEELVKLEGSTLTVQSYPSSYKGLNWEPYSYVVDGNENLFNGAETVTISGDFDKVDVYYRLTLSNYTEEQVEEILNTVGSLVDEADFQVKVMDKLAENEGQMKQLTKNMLNGLSGVIGGYSTENGGGLHADPTKNDELVAYFQATIAAIIGDCFKGQDLKLYNIIQTYNDPNNGGLIYYYQNDQYIINEIAVLSGYLNDMLDGGDRQAALVKLMSENGYSDKVDVLDGLKEKLATISAELKEVNPAIDTSDAAKLSALATALTMEGSVEPTGNGNPYIQMGPVSRVAEKFVLVEVKAVVGNKSETASVTIEKGAALTQAQVNDLKGKINAFIENSIDADLYTNNYNNGAELNALVGVALNEGASYTYEWTPKTYTIKIAGEADQTISDGNLTVNLPAHPLATNGMSYVYTVDSADAQSGIYTFTIEQVKRLFVNGEYTITRVEKNEAVEKLVRMVNDVNSAMGFEALTLVEENGLYTGIVANVATSDMMGLIQNLVLKSGYGYIGLNNEGLIYENDKAELEISIQTLINAILADAKFNNDTIIALGENGKGKLMTASMQLGDGPDKLEYSDLTFVMNLTSVPAQLTNNVGTLKTVSNYLYFRSNGGVLDVEVTLPDQVYGAYAAALYATGNVDKADVNDLNQAVALQFLYDYLTAITGSEMDMVTYTNTLKKLGIDKDLTGYNNYYTKGIKAYNEWTTVTIEDDGASLAISAPGNTVIDGLINVMGVDKTSLDTYLVMLKEYKADGVIEAVATATLTNTDKTYLALIADINADGVTNKFEAPSSYAALAEQTKSLADVSAMILLDNVPGDLTISGRTVLDLNGKTVNGSIHSTGTLIIIDSSMDTYNAGTVEGSVSGNVTILGGNYNGIVDSFLMDGYYKDGTAVRNALYYITDKDGTVTFVINGDVYEDENVDGILPNAKALAVDIAADLLLNYAMSGKLSVGGNDLIAINIEDLVGLYAGENRVNALANQLLECVFIGEEGYENNVGFEAVVNMIIEDVLDFTAISDALANDSALATYAITTEPWNIEIEHITDGNYATVDLTNNSAKAKTFEVALAIESKYNDQLSALTGELASIVVADETFAEVDIPKPTYADKTLTVVGKGQANAVVDMSEKEAYPVMITVILANGNAGKRAAVAEAINAAGGVDMAALKKVIDNTSVAEIFTALKVMNRTENFAAMAAKVGVTVDVTAASELEAVYHTVLCGMGKILEKLEITGMNSKLGNLYNEETGYYELLKEDIFRDKEFSARGYNALVEVTADELLLKVKLFGEVEEEPDCLWGDANHDDVVDELDASLILQYCVGEAPAIFCLLRTDVNGDGEITELDASLVLQFAVKDIDKFPVEK